MKKHEQAIEDFIIDYRDILGCGWGVLNQTRKIALDSVKYYKTPAEKRKDARGLQVLENRWYKSLDAGKPDFSIYDDPVYLGDLISCWLVYSSHYLRLIQKGDRNFNPVLSSLKWVKRVADLGCGLGYTTRELKRMFPNAEVIGTNVKDAVQTRFAAGLGKKHGFDVVTDLKKVGPVDLVFASEYFEHFYSPLTHLKEVLQLKPKALILANAFGSISIGHFRTYDIESLLPVSGSKASSAFNYELKSNGFRKVETGLWNSRPAYWSKCTVDLKQKER